MNSGTLKRVVQQLAPGAMSYKLRQDGTLSVVDARGRHVYFSADTVQATARKVWQRHPVTRGAGGATLYTCGGCGRGFRTRRGLSMHLNACKGG